MHPWTGALSEDIPASQHDIDRPLVPGPYDQRSARAFDHPIPPTAMDDNVWWYSLTNPPSSRHQAWQGAMSCSWSLPGRYCRYPSLSLDCDVMLDC